MTEEKASERVVAMMMSSTDLATQVTKEMTPGEKLIEGVSNAPCSNLSTGVKMQHRPPQPESKSHDCSPQVNNPTRSKIHAKS